MAVAGALWPFCIASMAAGYCRMHLGTFIVNAKTNPIMTKAADMYQIIIVLPVMSYKKPIIRELKPQRSPEINPNDDEISAKCALPK